jgi:PPM family protein phosphatase
MIDLTDKVEIVCKSDVGRNREHNEDSVGSSPSMGLAILADGMGGYQAGEIASAIAVSSILETLQIQFKAAAEAPQTEPVFGLSPQGQWLESAIIEANSKIFRAAQEKAQYAGMGTTVVAALMHDNIISIAHVGDSRLYRLRDEALELITEDHSLVRELVAKGFYTEEEARKATNKNVVTRALGVSESVEVEIQEDMALLEDIYLLCSDGLNDMLSDEEIEMLVVSNRDNLHSAAEKLVEAANKAGGKDNISAILLRPVKPFGTKKNWYGRIVAWFMHS